MMTKQTEALKMAIELLKMEIGELVLQKMRSGNDIPVSRCTITNSEIDAIFNDIKKEALTKPAQGSEQALCEQPVAWMDSLGYVMSDQRKIETQGSVGDAYTIPLYTHPAQPCQECENLKHDLDGYMEANKALIKREWQGLSDDENKIFFKTFDAYAREIDLFARAIEQALKEKNT